MKQRQACHEALLHQIGINQYRRNKECYDTDSQKYTKHNTE